ncbi:MAG: hypothetical protein R3F43_16225 [bacterium]
MFSKIDDFRVLVVVVVVVALVAVAAGSFYGIFAWLAGLVRAARGRGRCPRMCRRRSGCSPPPSRLPGALRAPNDVALRLLAVVRRASPSPGRWTASWRPGSWPSRRSAVGG